MDYKTLLVHAEGVEKSHAAMLSAIHLAQVFDAQVHGVYILPSMTSSVALVSGGQGAEVVKHWRRELSQLGEECEEAYTYLMVSSGVKWVWRMLEADGDNLGYELADYSRCVDLSITTQTQEGEDVLMMAQSPETLLLKSGKPVLVVPSDYLQAGSIGERIVIAWDRSQQASRAIADSMPLLSRAKSVTAVWVCDNPDDDKANKDCWSGLQSYLARHNVDVSVEMIEKGTDDVGQCVMRYATQYKADLIVAGGYGESRLKEYLLHGVTRSLLRDCKIPVLLSH